MIVGSKNLYFQRTKRKISEHLGKYMTSAAEKRQQTWIDRTSLELVRKLRLAFALYRDRQPGFAQVWSGSDRVSAQPMTVAYICDGRAAALRSPEYLKYILFGSSPAAAERGSVPVLKTGQAARALVKEADLVIVERNCLLNWKPAAGMWRTAPLWVHMVLDLSPERTWEEIEQGMRMHHTNIKKARRNGFTFSFTQDPADYDFFYERMLIPTVTRRFQDFASIKSKEEMGWFFRNGGIMQVRDSSGAFVAGELVYLAGKTGFSLANGILDGDETLYNLGAMSAVYYNRTRWCYDNGITRFDAGGCRPFTSDGVYEYKRRWGFAPVKDLWNEREWLIWVPSGAPAALRWLEANPSVDGAGSTR